MHMSELLRRELATLRERIGDGPESSLDILETGTIRNTGERYRVNDGWSTLAFAEDARDHGGRFTGIDLDVSAAQQVISDHGLGENVTFFEGYSVDILAGMLANAYGRAERSRDSRVTLGGAGFVDVALLDSDNDAGLILHEYMIVRYMMRSPGVIMVDDVDPDSTGVVKGHQLIPYLDANGVPYRLEKRHGDGYETGVLVIPV